MKCTLPQLIVRAALGFLIAFFISIPLELLIFDESIAAQIQIDKVSELQIFGKSATGAFNLNQIKDEEKRQEQKAKQIQQALNNPPPTEEYRNIKKSLVDCQANERTIKQKRDNANAQKNRFYQQTPSVIRNNGDGTTYNAGKNRQSSQWQNYLAKQRDESVLNAELRNQQSKCRQAGDALVEYVQNWQSQQTKTLTETKEKARLAGLRGDEAVEKTDSVQAEYEKTIQNQNGFVRRFVALGNAANKDQDLYMMLWLVRAIFILIEILPTIVKIYTPVGQYDWAVFQAEKDFREITLRQKTDQLQNNAEQEQAELARQQAFRLHKEGEVHDEIVKKLGAVQADVAKKVLDEYELQQTSQVRQNVNGFLNNGTRTTL